MLSHFPPVTENVAPFLPDPPPAGNSLLGRELYMKQMTSLDGFWFSTACLAA